MRSRCALVADWLRERQLTAAPIGIEETNRFFIVDRLRAQLPRVAVRNANAVVRGCRMIKSPAELALMQAASDITIAAIRETHAKLREGMTPDDISNLLEAGDGRARGHEPVGAGAARRGVGLSPRHGQAAGGQARRSRADRHRLRGARLPVGHFAQLRVRRRPDARAAPRVGAGRAGAEDRDAGGAGRRARGARRRHRPRRLHALGLWPRLQVARPVAPHRARHRHGGA